LSGGEPLPEVLRQIEAATDRETMLTVARELGGSELYISERPKSDSKLARAVGLEAARAIGKVLGRGVLKIPLGPMSDRAIKRELIRSLAAQGLSNAEIARRAHCDATTVRRTLSGETRRRPPAK